MNYSLSISFVFITKGLLKIQIILYRADHPWDGVVFMKGGELKVLLGHKSVLCFFRSFICFISIASLVFANVYKTLRKDVAKSEGMCKGGSQEGWKWSWRRTFCCRGNIFVAGIKTMRSRLQSFRTQNFTFVNVYIIMNGLSPNCPSNTCICKMEILLHDDRNWTAIFGMGVVEQKSIHNRW